MNRADDRCAGTARDGGPCTFTRAGHADGKPHAFVDAFDEVPRLKGELAEAESTVEMLKSELKTIAEERDEAYAGGARAERNECELTVRDSCICQGAECACSARLRDIARAIARRGSEGK